MKISALAVGWLIALAATSARADVLFSTMHSAVSPSWTRFVMPTIGATGTPTGPVPRGGPIAESFSVSAPTTITDVQLQLTANSNTDGGSVLVFLVPDAGSTPGFATSPTYTGTGSSLVLTGATQIAAIADSALPTTTEGSLLTINTYHPVGAGEYWLALENVPGSGGASAKWVFDTTAFTSGIGTAGQSVFWQAGAQGTSSYGAPGTFSDTSAFGIQNLYMAQVDAPEPLSIAVLAVGLTGLGVARHQRRRG